MSAVSDSPRYSDSHSLSDFHIHILIWPWQLVVLLLVLHFRGLLAVGRELILFLTSFTLFITAMHSIPYIAIF